MEAVFPGFFISSGQSFFFISHLRLDPRLFLIDLCIFLPRWILAWEPVGDWQHLLWDSVPPFLTPTSFYPCAVLESSLTSGVIDAVVLFLDSSRAQLLLLTLSLKCLGEAKLQFTTPDNLQLFSSGTHLPPTSEPPAGICWETSFTTLTVGLADLFASPWITPWAEMYQQTWPPECWPAEPLLSERFRAGMVLGPGGSLWGSSPAIAQRQGAVWVIDSDSLHDVSRSGLACYTASGAPSHSYLPPWGLGRTRGEKTFEVVWFCSASFLSKWKCTGSEMKVNKQ